MIVKENNKWEWTNCHLNLHQYSANNLMAFNLSPTALLSNPENVKNSYNLFNF